MHHFKFRGLNRFLLIAVLLLLALGAMVPFSAASEDREEGRLKYDGHRVYPGIFESRRIYQRPDYRDHWQANPSPAFLSKVPCYGARVHLVSYGEWRGRFTEGGGCSEAKEPTNYATGNYINYLGWLNSRR